MTLGEVFKKAWATYKKNIGILLLVVLLGALLVGIFIVPGLVAVFVALGGSLSSQGEINFSTFNIIGLVIFGLTIILGSLASIVYTGALVRAVGLADEGKNIKISEVFGFAYHKFWHLLISSLLAGIFIFLGFLIFVIPGLALAIYFQFVMFVVIFENKWGMAAVKRSYEIVKGNFWWVVLIVVLTGLISSAVGYIPFIGALLAFLLVPLWQVVYYLVYKDLQGLKRHDEKPSKTAD